MKTFSLAVAQPCQQSWEGMTQREKGRFCAACIKTVVDFSVMSDRQLAVYFSANKSTLCGRFHSYQLDRQIDIPPRPVPWLRPIVPLALTAMTLMLEACSPGNDVTGAVTLSENEVRTATEKENHPIIVNEKILIHPMDTISPSEKESKAQVSTEKRKAVHPAFIPVDTMRLPALDTVATPLDTAKTEQKPLLQPRKETFIMGRVLNTYHKAKETQRKKGLGENESM